ncbi:MAG TPA: 30S ribosome-binding factor RbfA [Gammaproteobacteria bacterium]|nr:30S ribosome-binding factor RbfA [Gammaproteobacteria bacterium]
MSKEFSRSRRVGEQMQRELAQLIQREVKDPRLGMVTVSGVDVSRDYSVAKVYITVLGDNADPAQTLAILNKVSGFLRHELGQRMVLRTVPALTFHYDESVERGSELSRLIDEAVSKDRDSNKD